MVVRPCADALMKWIGRLDNSGALGQVTLGLNHLITIGLSPRRRCEFLHQNRDYPGKHHVVQNGQGDQLRTVRTEYFNDDDAGTLRTETVTTAKVTYGASSIQSAIRHLWI
jgi:hypothetical protein